MEYLMTVNVVGTKELQEKLHKIYSSFNKEMLQATNLWVKIVQRHIMMNKLSGQVLNMKSGLLRASIASGVVMIPGAKWTAYIIADRVYAAVHEFGAIIQIPRYRKNTPLIIDKLGKKKKKTGYYTVNIPERSYIRSTVEEDEPILLDFIMSRFGDLLSENS